SSDGKKFSTGSEDKTFKVWDIDSEQIQKRWQESGPQAELILPQLQKYHLQNLLNLRPENEAKLIATKEEWQIKAFADLDASEAAGSNILERGEPLYARADRLYTAALELQDEELIRRDYSKMLKSWAAVYQSDGQERKAKELEEKADGLWNEK